MSLSMHMLASGPGWRAEEVICSAGPHDRPFEEQHELICVAVVTRGTFQYRTPDGRATLAPGGLLLGNAGACFECGHEHGVGDRCLSFHFDPEYFEEIVASIPGAHRLGFTTPRLPPSDTLLPVVCAAEVADNDFELEEAALRVAGAAVVTQCSATEAVCTRHERRINEVLRWIEIEPDEPVTLTGLACRAAMSPYHFLRTFRTVSGMTPYQFLLAQRLRRAAARLRQTTDPISAIAYEAGFSDLSTFNRRFRRMMGITPGAWRSRQR